VPAAAGACLLWAIAYSLIGIVSGGLFDNPLIATLLAAVLILLITGLLNLLAARRRRRKAERQRAERETEPTP
jgi:drug/metabolite transporter (DMT)-like permease